jgi:ParB family chromosome partitioning protein
MTATAQIRTIPLSQINEPPEPVRVTMDEPALYELRDSIRAIGLLQPIIVVPIESSPAKEETEDYDGVVAHRPAEVTRYEIVAGHRRFLAARLVPLKEVECKVYDSAWDAKLAAMVAENAFREDVTAAEEGWKYLAAVEQYKPNEAELCAMFHQSAEYIYARMDMCTKDPNIATLVAQRKLNFSVAKELLKCSDESHRAYLAQLCAESGATARVARSYVQQYVTQQSGPLETLTQEAQPDTGSMPVENTVRCWCCGGDKDAQNLKLIYIHWYELEGLKKVLVEAGLAPGGTASVAGAS